MNNNETSYQQILDKVERLEKENHNLQLQKNDHAIQEINLKEQAFFNSISDNLPGYIAYVNANTLIYEFVNKAFEKSFGISREKIIGSHIKDVIGEENYQFALKYIEEVRAGKSVSYINTFNLDTGKRWARVNYVPHFDVKGNVISIIVLTYDITTLKQVEEKLQESETLLNETGKIAKVAGWKFNIETKQITWTKEIFRILEVSEDFHLTQESASSFYDSHAKDKILKAVNYTIQHRKPFDVEIEITTAKNNKLQLRIISNVKNNEKGSPEILFGTIQDVSELKKGELALKKNQQILNEISKIGRVGGWEINIDTLKQTWTKETYSIHEVDPSFEPTVENGINFYSPASIPIITNAVKQAIEQSKSFDVQLEIITAKGNHRFVHAIGKADIQNRRVYGFFQDITNRKNHENIISQQNLALKKLNYDKDLFITILAHDLKNPFNSILVFLELLTENVREYEIDKIEQLLNSINQSAQNAFELLEDLLLWTKSQTGKLVIKHQKIVFDEICAEIINDLQIHAITKGISIQYFDHEKTVLSADLNMFKTILRNLISNAIKFTNRNGQIKISIEKNHPYATIVVSDTGVGIAKDQFVNLWDFTNLISTKGTSGEIGTGFGLLLCKEFVEKHDGKIWVESEIGKGSDFKFTMPLHS